MLTDQKRDEMFIRMDERLGKTREDVKELKAAMYSEEGFTRCQLHKQAVDNIANSMKWSKRGIWTAIFAFMAKIGFDYFSK